ncbi:RHS repeat-associated core domain-containing protein [Teredinibacter haidensis]|uniref:RHS repeat-associated core domain-containing protein n=1 Tax=Teredinibacter haidensis TaxID=2731755 RepID=UPI000B199338|nr:RHS repeat-associated core domain-containing protein [Teredinibacter haidensis]
MPIAQVTDTYSNNTFQATDTIFIHADHLNTPRLATSQSQTKVWEWNSDVFGVGLANEDPDNDTNLTKINLRFPGQYFDGESGLHYNYFRDYDPSLGRYIQSDPTGLNDGPNTYAYVHGNPINYYDPNGESAVHAARGAFWVGGRIGAGINYGIQAVTGATLGSLLYDALNDDTTDDSSDDSQQSKKDRCIECCSDSALPTNDNGFSFWNCVNRCMEEPDECK